MEKEFNTNLARLRLNLRRRVITTLQINLGKLCNQACSHCHVEAGPKRTEIMSAETASLLLSVLKASPSVRTVDITGGAPELCPEFRRLVQAVRAQGLEVIDRCNLTVFFEPGQEDLPEFLSAHQVRVIASLPCYSQANVDKQRGRGTFGKSIAALQRLNALGYGREKSLVLDLVYNPLGPSLPPPQKELEADYRVRLERDFGIQFGRLFCLTNMPIKRFYEDLKRNGRLEEYQDLLFQNFNLTAALEVMCRDLISVSWDGKIYDCDFNQMLEMPIASRHTLRDLKSLSPLAEGPIVFADHCYGCTAGVGSSCTGALS